MAYLAIEKPLWPFKTLEEFADSDFGFYIPRGTFLEELIYSQVISVNVQSIYIGLPIFGEDPGLTLFLGLGQPQRPCHI